MSRKRIVTIVVVLALVLAMSLMLVACKDSKKDESKDDKVVTLTSEEELTAIKDCLAQARKEYSQDVASGELGEAPMESAEKMIAFVKGEVDKVFVGKLNASIPSPSTYIRIYGDSENYCIYAEKSNGEQEEVFAVYEVTAPNDFAAVLLFYCDIKVNADKDWYCAVNEDIIKETVEAVEKSKRQKAIVDANNIKSYTELLITDIAIDSSMSADSATVAANFNENIGDVDYVTGAKLEGTKLTITTSIQLSDDASDKSIVFDMQPDLAAIIPNGFDVSYVGGKWQATNRSK